MRWMIPPPKPRPFPGEIRIRTGFLWLPKTCRHDADTPLRELRWLERASWVEEYQIPYRAMDEGWVAQHWMSEPKP